MFAIALKKGANAIRRHHDECSCYKKILKATFNFTDKRSCKDIFHGLGLGLACMY